MTRAFVMVWDGMRPDLVSPGLTPNLWSLAARGVRFLDSHAVFPTVTRVNSASLSTGVSPAAHGIAGNTIYAPLVNPSATISVGDQRSLFALIQSRGGRLVPCDTLADRLAAIGDRTVVISSGTPGSALLCHPRVQDCPGDRLFHPALSIPNDGLALLAERFGPLPKPAVPNSAVNHYFTRAIVEFIFPELQPRLLIFWHNDPDKTQHNRGFGSPEALQAIRDADTNLGRVLGGLAESGGLAETVVAVVSDHGYASIEPAVEPGDWLIEAGFGLELESGRLILAKNGFSLFAYDRDGEPALIERVALAFQDWEYGGVTLSGARGQSPVDGTLPLSLAGLDGELAPDVHCALAWDNGRNSYGYSGRSAGLDGQYFASHGGISPWEVRNTFVLAGPGVKAGLEHARPAGNLDVCPTLLQLLDIPQPSGLQGRVLREALVEGPAPAELIVERELAQASRGAFHQTVRFSLVEGARYLDYGWAERTA